MVRILRIREAAEHLGATPFAVARMIYGFLFEYGEGKVQNDLLPLEILRVPDRFYVVVDDGEIVAVGAININTGYISRVCVHPSYRRRGLATKLNRFFFDLAKKHGLKYVWCYVRRPNEPAMRLLLRLGFRIDEKTPYHYKMIRVLPPR